jgi:hypothetical protein
MPKNGPLSDQVFRSSSLRARNRPFAVPIAASVLDIAHS